MLLLQVKGIKIMFLFISRERLHLENYLNTNRQIREGHYIPLNVFRIKQTLVRFSQAWPPIKIFANFAI